MDYQRRDVYPNLMGFIMASGDIVEVGDVDLNKWPNSEWRCIKVKWDESYKYLNLPLRVSPWTIMINNEEVENTSITAPSLIDFFTESSIDETILCEGMHPNSSI
ncbi:unnamed protein product [Cuscuta europaea]|uniref:Auxin response factor domain-containing protein n=1 Tax=Cuscuta europaea TaxID=41803 RepID=A0A9P0YRC5_CUSEU|nr:unnamed protein product [Cuscuta europaea]